MNAKQLFCGILFLGTTFSITAQTTADLLKVHDTRNVVDAPGFLQYGIRADMKPARASGLPAHDFSTTISISPWKDNSAGKVHQLNFNNEGMYYRNAYFMDVNWGEWKKVPLMQLDGSTEKLVVAGQIHAKEVLVSVTAGADYVFQSDYKLKSISELKEFINTNKHLPDIPSEKEMQENGLSMNEFQIKLLQKIEELTLYTIRQQEEIDYLKSQLNK